MTDLTIQIPHADQSEITAQLLKHTDTKIYDLGDTLKFLKRILVEEDYNTLDSGVKMLLGLMLEQAGEVEVKIIVSKT